MPLFAHSNAIIVASELGRHRRARELADCGQEAARGNSYIYHSAACAYVAAGEPELALEQVRLAVASGYEHLDRLRVDSDLGPLLEDPAFQALFADESGASGIRRT